MSRIYLRKIIPSDIKTLYKWGQDPLYHNTACFEKMTSMAQAKVATDCYMARKYSYAIVLAKTKQMIGLIELYNHVPFNGAQPICEVGFLLQKDYWHQGLMKEAMDKIINFAFNKLELKQVWAVTFADNRNAQSFLEKYGFEYVKTVDTFIEEIFRKELYFVLTDR